jgi:hypothetical protein
VKATVQASQSAPCVVLRTLLSQTCADVFWGFPKDEKMARRYFSMVATASIEDCSDVDKRVSKHMAACLSIQQLELASVCFGVQRWVRLWVRLTVAVL